MEQIIKRKRKENDFGPVKIKKSTSSVLLKLPNEIWSIVIREVPIEFSLPIKLTCSFFRFIELNEKRNMDRIVYRNRNLTVIYAKWAVFIGFRLDEHTIKNAAANGDLEVLKYLHENGCPWDEWSCAHAAKNGDLKMLIFLHENKCPWNENACSVAAANGDLEVLKWLHENGCPWDEWSCLNAGGNGYLEILKYLHKNGCPWDEWSYAYATYNRHLEVLKYLHENGCPCDKQECIKYARKYNHKEYLEYLLQI